uniref:NR LBD domain-containing protein n=1 Tax=Scophthalmus maximus TaxID=52904 RepID=A0A8D3DE43_SCOMX
MWSCECRGREEPAQSSILFSLLNRGSARPQAQVETPAAHQRATCASSGEPEAIRAAQGDFTAACEVLVRTFRFVRSVPCFRCLPVEDQLRLVRNSWAPLLVLGMAQDSVRFGAAETQQQQQQPSLLHRILTHSKEGQQRTAPGTPDPDVVTVGDVEGIRLFLLRCRGLRISVKEFAFLKGAILFSPEVSELECRDYIRALQTEAERALYVHVRTVHRGNAARLCRLRAALNALRAMDPRAVAGLFFRPVTGTSCVDEHVLAMFFRGLE